LYFFWKLNERCKKTKTETQHEKIEANGGKGNRKRKHNVKKIEKEKPGWILYKIGIGNENKT
jgi:hypothetical protein